MLEDPRFLWWVQAFGYAAFGAVGGFMGHLLRTMDRGEPISWSRASLEGGSAAFVGFITMLLCQAMNLSPEWTGAIVGVFGWLGASVSIRMLESVVRKRLGIDPSLLEKTSNVVPETDPASPRACEADSRR